MQEVPFKVRCYEKRELAGMYFPSLRTDIAVKKLRRWMNKCTPLNLELEEANYQVTMKGFTAKEVRLIIKHLGEPD